MAFLCFSTFLPNSQMPAENVRGTSTSGNHDHTPLAHSSMVATAVENDNCNPSCVTKTPGLTFTITLSPDASLVKKETDYAGMSPVWQSIQIKEGSWKAHHGLLAGWDKEPIQYLHHKMAKLL